MTLNAFIKKLQKLAGAGHGRAKVTADRPTFYDGNGTWNICDVRSVKHDRVNQINGDGFHEENKDGSERTKSCIVISGDYE